MFVSYLPSLPSLSSWSVPHSTSPRSIPNSSQNKPNPAKRSILAPSSSVQLLFNPAPIFYKPSNSVTPAKDQARKGNSRCRSTRSVLTPLQYAHSSNLNCEFTFHCPPYFIPNVIFEKISLLFSSSTDELHHSTLATISSSCPLRNQVLLYHASSYP